MTLKRAVPVLLIFLASIALGIFYNTYLIEYHSFDHSSMLPRYLLGIFTVLLFFVQGALLHYSLMYTFEKHKNKLPLLLGYMSIAALIIYIIKRTYFGVNYLNVFIMIYIYPFATLGVIPQFYKKYGSLYSSIVFAFLIATCGFISDIKMILFSAVIFIVAEFISIKLVNPPKKKYWYWHVGILAVITVLSFCIMIFLKWNIFDRRIAGFFNPDSILEYRMLLDWLSNCEWISFSPSKMFVEDINSLTACPYAHIMTCFGILPTVVFIVLQAFMVLLVFRNSIRFEDTTRKYLGIISSVMIGLHLALSLCSSFYIIPMVGYGAPFLLTTGIGLSYIPILLYFYLECIEYYKNKTKKSVYKKLHTNDGGANN